MVGIAGHFVVVWQSYAQAELAYELDHAYGNDLLRY